MKAWPLPINTKIMSEFPDNIKFLENNGKHLYKRINEEGGTEYTSPEFDTLEAAQADARTNINGVHANDAQESGSEPAPEQAPEAPANAEAKAEDCPEPEASADSEQAAAPASEPAPEAEPQA